MKKGILAGVAALLVVIVAVLAFMLWRSSPGLSAKYHAVLLNNGSVYFGQLEALNTPHPILRDVFYVQSSVNPETKAVTNVLVKRGKEWHGPDRMILNSTSIVFIEPVGPNSRVAQLIAEANK